MDVPNTKKTSTPSCEAKNENSTTNKLPEHEEERRNVAPEETETAEVPKTKKTCTPVVENPAARFAARS